MISHISIYKTPNQTIQALKDSFSLPDARTVMIATVSPASKDTEHSLSTLRHACLMIAKDDSNGKESETETDNDDGTVVSSSGNSNNGGRNDNRAVTTKRNNGTSNNNNSKGKMVHRGESRPGMHICIFNMR